MISLHKTVHVRVFPENKNCAWTPLCGCGDFPKWRVALSAWWPLFLLIVPSLSQAFFPLHEWQPSQEICSLGDAWYSPHSSRLHIHQDVSFTSNLPFICSRMCKWFSKIQLWVTPGPFNMAPCYFYIQSPFSFVTESGVLLENGILIFFESGFLFYIHHN